MIISLQYASDGREHAMWFIDTKVIDGVELRKWMGTVKDTIVAKHAARMGLVGDSQNSQTDL